MESVFDMSDTVRWSGQNSFGAVVELVEQQTKKTSDACDLSKEIR